MLTRFTHILTGRSGKGQEAPSLDGMLAGLDRHLENFETLIEPAPESRPRTPFDSGLPTEEISLAKLTNRQRLKVVPILLPLLVNMNRSAKMYDGKFRPGRSSAGPVFVVELERLARQWGAKDMKYVNVPRNAIFQGRGIPHAHAVVFTVEMDKAAMATAPSFECQLEVMRGYKRLASIGNKLARLMQREGYAAYPGTALGGVTDYDYLAELAGLGAIGYHGMLITPGEGTRLRINTIYTNIENLPVQPDNEHLWVREFCASCKKCIRICPADAIFDQPRPRGDGGMQCIAHKACRDYFTRNYGCAVCLAGCPFSQKGYEFIKQRFKGNPEAPQIRIPLLRRDP